MTKIGETNSTKQQPGIEDKNQHKFARKPILGHGRTPSYGSCNDEPQTGAPTQKHIGQAQMFRYQIGSKVFDFGESPLFWPGPLKNRLHKIPSKKVFSWLGFSDAHNQSEATLPVMLKNLPPQPVPSMYGDIVYAGTPPKQETANSASRAFKDRGNSLANNTRGNGTRKVAGRSVFSLFGFDRNQIKTQNANGRLKDVTNAVGQPQAHAAIVYDAQLEPHKLDDETHLPAWIQTEDGPRSISLTKYLEEISKVGANGARNNVQKDVEHYR